MVRRGDPLARDPADAGYAAAMLLFAYLACAGGLDPDAYHWDVTVVGADDGCHAEGDTVAYREDFTYALYYDGSSTTLKIEGDTFASGVVSGCTVTYESVETREDRGDGFVRWKLEGEALHQQDGASCGIEANAEGQQLDWTGTETFTLLETDLAGYDTPCSYTMTVEGTFVPVD